MDVNTLAQTNLNVRNARLDFVVLLLLPVLFTTACTKGNLHAATSVPAVEVRVAPVVQQDVPVYSEWVATLDGYVNAQIQPQVSGYIIRQGYKEGSLVRRGQVLFEIDPRPFKAALDRARGDLAQARAQLGKSTLDVERDTPLAQDKAIAQSQLDNEMQAKLGAQAAVESAKAAVEQAELNMGFTKVTSLVDGIAGIAQAQLGNLVGPSSVLTSVSQVDPIKVSFAISEQEYLNAQHNDPAITHGNALDLFGNSLELTLSDGTTYPRRGKILWADRQVDPNTGTIRLVAAFPNPANVLRPGQYGRVRVEGRVKKGALLLAQGALSQSQGSYQVAVVGRDHRVSIRTVVPAEKVATMQVIDKGLAPGELVVVEGIQKLKDGTFVTPRPVSPSGEAH